MKEYRIKELKIFENYKKVCFEEGHVVFTTEVVESSLNYHDTAHGGYLFALSDHLAGAVGVSTGYDVVTQQASINYLKPGLIGDTLTIDGKCLHNGKMTKVIEVVISNQKEQVLSKATFTMFVTGKREE